MTDHPNAAPRSDAAAVEARLALFGFPASDVVVELRPRSRSWRVRGAAQIMAVFLVIAPLAALLPPHAPWALGALGVGGILARRRFAERFTLLRIEGLCPKCGAEIRSKSGRLKTPHAVHCDGCHHEATLKIPDDALDALS